MKIKTEIHLIEKKINKDNKINKNNSKKDFVDYKLFDDLEKKLLNSDVSLNSINSLLLSLRNIISKNCIKTRSIVKKFLKSIISYHINSLEKRFDLKRKKPIIILVIGVNGSGKTTSIGKLTNIFQKQGFSVILGACDTFRAAAKEQLDLWGKLNNVSVISQIKKDPAAIAFNTIQIGYLKNIDIIIIDTAGRLPNQINLIYELNKIYNVIRKINHNLPNEILLVIDGSTGQNAISQIYSFDSIMPITGLIITKVEGNNKGGLIISLSMGNKNLRKIPVYWIGIGEGLKDIKPFITDAFINSFKL